VPGFGSITASFGLATFPSHASSRDTLVVAADRALYHSKNEGRNRVSLSPEEISQAEVLKAEVDSLLDEIAEALQAECVTEPVSHEAGQQRSNTI
jgi:predicted signal transduction protein with EAL and GGDEF domain